MKQEIKERVERIRRGEVPEGYKETKVGIIPVDWDVKKIGALTSSASGTTPSREKQKIYYTDGTHLWVKTTDLNNNFIKDTSEKVTQRALDETACKLLPKNTILVAMYGGFNQIGRTGLLKKEAACNQALTGIYSNDNFDSQYLQEVLNSRTFYWKKFAASSRKDPNITRNDVMQFPVPHSNKTEEKKIADILSTWDKAIELKEKIIEEKKVQKENHLRNIFSEKFLKNNFEIKKIQLKDILKQFKDIHYIEDDKLYRQVTISKNGNVSFRGEKLGNKIGRKRQFTINLDKHPESLIFIRQGVLNGGIGIIPKEVNCCVVTENMPMFRIVDIDVTYLKWLIKSPSFRNRIKKIIPDGTAQKAIHEKVLLLESFIIPKDIKDQKIIANIVSLQFNEIELLESELEQTKKQKKGLMQLLLTGIVRVEVD